MQIEAIEAEPRTTIADAETIDAISWKAAFGISIAAFSCVVALIIILPAFSSGDGPVHVYYASVMRALFMGDPWYTRVYAIRHIIQPYSLHYLIMSALLWISSPGTAEKLLVLLAVIVGWTGLVRAIHAFHPDTAALYTWVLPLTLTWSLAGGFYNFCLASGFFFHSLAEWTYLRKTGRMRHLVGVILLVLLLALSHPLPLLLLAGYVSLEIVLSRWMVKPYSQRRTMIAASCVLAALAAPALVYDRGRIASEMHFSFHELAAQFIITGESVDFFTFNGYHFIYRVALISFPVIAIISLLSGVCDRFKSRRLDQADALLLAASIVLASAPFIPSTLNGALYGERRLAALAWPVLCIALAGRSMKQLVPVRLFAAVGCALTIAAVYNLNASLQPASELMQAMDHAPFPTFRTGLFLETEEGIRKTQGSSYGVAYWAGVRGFVSKHDLLLNSPWLTETHIPIQERQGASLMNGIIGQDEINTPVRLYGAMLGSASLREAISSRIDFAVIVDPSDDPAGLLYRALDHSHLWDCKAERGVYAICVKRMR